MVFRNQKTQTHDKKSVTINHDHLLLTKYKNRGPKGLASGQKNKNRWCCLLFRFSVLVAQVLEAEAHRHAATSEACFSTWLRNQGSCDKRDTQAQKRSIWGGNSCRDLIRLIEILPNHVLCIHLFVDVETLSDLSVLSAGSGCENYKQRHNTKTENKKVKTQ